MSKFAEILLEPVKLTLRQTGSDFDKEISSYIEECATDLQDAGILSSYFTGEGEVNSQIVRAVRWYCLSVFGLFNPDMEKYQKAYQSLKATLCTQRRYTEG